MTIATGEVPLKQFLALFSANDRIAIEELADTGHPASGFVDQRILGALETVGDVVAFDYDFNGLVFFKAQINGFSICFESSRFYIKGKPTDLTKLISKIKTAGWSYWLIQ